MCRLRSVYNLPTSDFTGSNIRVAILSYQKFDSQVVINFAKENGIAKEPFILDSYVVNPNIVPEDDPSPTLVNLELAVALAPEADYTVTLCYIL